MSGGTSRMRAAGELAVLAVIGAFLLLPLLHGDDDGTGVANTTRDLAPRPAVPATWKQARRWPRHYEQWLDDHFGFRSQLLALHTALLVRGFGVSPTDQVLLGDGDWLYFANDRLLEDRRGELRLSHADAERWRSALEGREAALAQRGVVYAFAIAPNKVTVHPEHLPPRHRERPPRPTRIDQLAAHLAARSSFRIVDGRDLLRATAATSKQLYHATDTHWNDAGALLFQQALLEALAAKGCVRTPLPRERFVETWGSFEGDLVRLVPALVRREQTATFEARPPLRARPVELPPELLALPRPGGAPEPTSAYANDDAKGVLLCFGDSFLAALRPLLAEHFARSYFVRGTVGDAAVLQAWVDAVRPTAVVEQRVERNLAAVPDQHVWSTAR